MLGSTWQQMLITAIFSNMKDQKTEQWPLYHSTSKSNYQERYGYTALQLYYWIVLREQETFCLNWEHKVRCIHLQGSTCWVTIFKTVQTNVQLLEEEYYEKLSAFQVFCLYKKLVLKSVNLTSTVRRYWSSWYRTSLTFVWFIDLWVRWMIRIAIDSITSDLVLTRAGTSHVTIQAIWVIVYFYIVWLRFSGTI